MRSGYGSFDQSTLGKRAREIFRLLLEHENVLVTRDLILKKVWRNTVVEANSVDVQIAKLRRLLPDGVIRTVYGAGYMLVSPTIESVISSLTVDLSNPNECQIPNSQRNFCSALQQAIEERVQSIAHVVLCQSKSVSGLDPGAVELIAKGLLLRARTLIRRGLVVVHLSLVDQESQSVLWSARHRLSGQRSEREIDTLADAAIAALDRESARQLVRVSRPGENHSVRNMLHEAYALSLDTSLPVTAPFRDALYEKVLELDPHNPTALSGKASALVHRVVFLPGECSAAHRLSLMREGVYLAKQVISAGFAEREAFGAMGSFFSLQGDLRQGLFWDAKRFEIDRYSSQSHLNMAESYLLTASPDKAIELVDRFTVLNGGISHLSSPIVLGPAHLQLGRLHAAARILETGVSSSGTFHSILFWLAITYRIKGDIKRAQKNLEELFLLDPMFKSPWGLMPTPNHPERYVRFWQEIVSPAAAGLGLSECVIH